MRFRKPEPIPLLFLVFSVLLLSGLGMWQVERLRWKQGQIAAIEKAQGQPALGTLPQALDGLEYRHVVLTGTFLHEETMHMVGHPQGMGNGFFIVTPFQLDDDGRIILINRGFAPEGQESKPEGLQTVEGIIRPFRLKRPFSPENRPDRNIWFYEEMDAMSRHTGLELTPLMVEATGERVRGTWPYPSDGKITLRNDHLNYAVTWFSLAFIAIVMFGFYYRERKEPLQ